MSRSGNKNAFANQTTSNPYAKTKSEIQKGKSKKASTPKAKRTPQTVDKPAKTSPMKFPGTTW